MKGKRNGVNVEGVFVDMTKDLETKDLLDFKSIIV